MRRTFHLIIRKMVTLRTTLGATLSQVFAADPAPKPFLDPVFMVVSDDVPDSWPLRKNLGQ